ncbi:MAG: hypothetical protein LBH32_00070, partial [Dysgonamonadaceae bacterium]|nr:hypothetical protein [Dysgonamonadaceae bacterium]
DTFSIILDNYPEGVTAIYPATPIPDSLRIDGLRVAVSGTIFDTKSVNRCETATDDKSVANKFEITDLIRVTPSVEEKEVRFVLVTYGGCNGQSEFSPAQRSSSMDVKNDTVFFDFQNDTLKVSVGINYICCSSFEATQNVEGEKISLLITETTPSPEEYCRCDCYYTFDYYFTDLSKQTYEINVAFDAKDDNKDKNFSKHFNF